MRWAELAEQDLENYRGLKASLENITGRIRTLEMKAQSISSGATDRERVAGGGKPLMNS